MWKIFIFTLVMLFCCPVVSSAGGITGGTTRNTSQKQDGAFQHRMNNQQCKDPGVPAWMLKKAREGVAGSSPVMGIGDKALKGMEWSSKKQRELGGVPPTGSTTKRIK